MALGLLFNRLSDCRAKGLGLGLVVHYFVSPVVRCIVKCESILLLCCFQTASTLYYAANFDYFRN